MPSQYLYVMSDDKPGGILTPSMREFYRETPNETGSQARSVRQRTRERFMAALEDIQTLHHHLRDDDRRAIVDEMNPSKIGGRITDLIAIFAEEIEIGQFEQIVETGLNRALIKKGYPAAEASVTINIDRDPATVDGVIEKIDNGGRLTEKEKNALIMYNDKKVLSDEQMEILRRSDYQKIWRGVKRDQERITISDYE